MPVQLLCPNVQCGKTYTVSDETAGRRWKCRQCGTTLGGVPKDDSVKDTKDAMKGSSLSDQTSDSSQQAELPKQIGPYQIRKSLGNGAFGQVFLAFDPKLDRQVALKVPHPGVLNNAKATERFLREAKAGARLHHTNIVTVFDAGRDEKYHYIASVYIKGQTLKDALEKGPWDYRRSAEAIRQLALALAYAHQKGIVHRDVKPANILIDDLGQLYLTDFGIASLMDAAEKLTQTGAVMGTAAYMSPEVGQGATGETSPACDQYSLGVLLYELLCNQLPFTGMPGYVIHSHIHQAPKSPREIAGTISPELEAICLKAMAKKPADRYVDCKAMADALLKWLEAPAISVPPAERVPEPPKAQTRSSKGLPLAPTQQELDTALAFLCFLKRDWPAKISTDQWWMVFVAIVVPLLLLFPCTIIGLGTDFAILVGFFYVLASPILANLYAKHGLNASRSAWLCKHLLEYSEKSGVEFDAVIQILSEPVDRTWDRKTSWAIIQVKPFKDEIERLLRPHRRW